MRKRDIQEICEEYHIRPSKAKGQNFLIDETIVEKIIESSGLSLEDTVLEIGPGLGVLTSELVINAKQVIAVEVDRQAIKYLNDNFGEEIKAEKLKIVEGDALRINYKELGLKDFNFKIVANLPYSITSHFFKNFLELGPKPEEIVVMIQYEVAKRMIAEPGEMNLLALSVQLYSEAEILFKVPPQSFWPEPEVDSAVVRLILKKEMPDADIKQMFKVAKIGFSSKRKQLHNNLFSGLKLKTGAVKGIFAGFGWREDIRAQDLSLDDWVKLSKVL